MQAITPYQQTTRKQFTLKWQSTITEDANVHYEITRVDARGNQETIAKVLADPFTTEYTYKYYDVISDGLYEYVIREIDSDRGIIHSAQIDLEVDKPIPSVVVFPNPVSDNLTISIDGMQQSDWLRCTIYNQAGEKMTHYQVLDFDIAKGVYLSLIHISEPTRPY